MKVDLGFDVDTLRIFDIDEDDEQATSSGSSNTGASAIANALKRTNSSPTTTETPDEGVAAPKIRAQTDSTKLRDFLNNLGDE
jgi:hypothetical protein